MPERLDDPIGDRTSDRVAGRTTDREVAPPREHTAARGHEPGAERAETIGVVFGLDEKAKGDRRLDPADVAKLTATIAAELRNEVPPLQLPGAASECLTALRGALARPVGTILTTAWNQRRDFLKYTDRAKYPPEAVSRVALHPHTVKWTYRPSIRVLLNGRPVRTLSFVVEIGVKLSGAEVAVQDGRFVRLHTGKSQVTATLRCGEVVLAKRSSGEYELPGTITLGDGVPIARVVTPFSFTAAPAATPAPGAPRA
jgi:hypothetical protein